MRRKEVGYCIVHNPLFLQPLRHWLTLIYREHEHLAAWVIGSRSYWLSWALPFGIASPLTTFILYHKLFSLSIPFLRFFWWTGWDSNPHSLRQKGQRSLSNFQMTSPFCQVLYFSEKILGENLVVSWVVFLLPLTLLYHKSDGMSRGFFNFFIPLGDDSAGIGWKGEPAFTQSSMGAISFPLRCLLSASLLTLL